MIYSDIVAGDNVSLVWSDLGPDPDHLQSVVTQVQQAVGEFEYGLCQKDFSIYIFDLLSLEATKDF